MLARARWIWLLFLLVSTGLCLTWRSSSRNDEPVAFTPGPRLLVLVVFDQMRGDYLERWRDIYGPDGFNKLTSEGAWFANCHYPYSLTVTGAGHATLGTGCTPSQHGIVENEWYDRAVGKSAYCATLGSRYRMIPLGSKSKTGNNSGGSPERLLVPALGEVVKAATRERGKVIGISMKDRGCVLPTGRQADICYWFDDHAGAFVTSSYYTDRLPQYMADLNAAKLADRWFSQSWTKFRPDLDYTKYAGPDDVIGEGTGEKQGRTFPHPLNGGKTKLGNAFYNAIYSSPFGNELTWTAAKVVLEQERLGQDDATDYLVISFSCNDPVGHSWGPDSQEVLDICLRSDALMADVIRTLDERVGRDHYLLALSADHGVCPIPEVAKTQGKPGNRVDGSKVTAALEEHLTKQIGPYGKWIEALTGSGYYLNSTTLRSARKSRGEVEKIVAQWLKGQPFVKSVYTRTQMLSSVQLDEDGERIRASFHPSRSGDVFPVLKPYHILSKYLTGTTHGSPHPYDTHVPLVIFGAGVIPGKRTELVSPQAAAVILADSIGQKMPRSLARIPGDVLVHQSNRHSEDFVANQTAGETVSRTVPADDE